MYRTILLVIFVVTLLNCCGSNDSKILRQVSPDADYAAKFSPKLKSHLRISSSHGIDAEEKYKNSLKDLRATNNISQELFEAYKAVPVEFYGTRVLIVQTLKEVRDSNALPYLEKIVYEKLPLELSAEGEVFTQENELIIKLTATEGINYLAESNCDEISRVLYRLIQETSDISIKQIAIKGYLNCNPKEVESKKRVLIKTLKKSDHWLINEKYTNIKSVKHPELGTFNLDDFKSDSKPPKSN